MSLDIITHASRVTPNKVYLVSLSSPPNTSSSTDSDMEQYLRGRSELEAVALVLESRGRELLQLAGTIRSSVVLIPQPGVSDVLRYGSRCFAIQVLQMD